MHQMRSCVKEIKQSGIRHLALYVVAAPNTCTRVESYIILLLMRFIIMRLDFTTKTYEQLVFFIITLAQ